MKIKLIQIPQKKIKQQKDLIEQCYNYRDIPDLFIPGVIYLLKGKIDPKIYMYVLFIDKAIGHILFDSANKLTGKKRTFLDIVPLSRIIEKSGYHVYKIERI